MPFQVRIGAMKWDLGQDGLLLYERCRRVAIDLGFGKYMTEAVIVTLIERYGAEKTEWGIMRLHGRANYSLDTLVKIIEGSIPAERTAPSFEKPAAPSRDRSNVGPRSVQEFLGQHPPKKLTGPVRPGAKPDGLYKLPEVHRWLHEQGLDIRLAEKYFTFWGVDTANNQLWVLRPEHIQKSNTNENNIT